eukprot:TRINITY_DN450_c1_g1_i1.p1 TRINITY_DN450_c1_g1~~TRINITY_DN450_c1_g1_i1.p1  ORF type:complete len:781 (-),score=362.26 TRINITY_DN450_c1_g1_i1:1129-3471(-)
MAVYTWGENQYGQLGCGEVSHQLSPVVVEGLKKHRVTDISVGEFISAAVTEQGAVYVWGRGKEGFCTNGRMLKNYSPIRVDALEPFFITQIRCGYNHCLALTNEGQVFQWGSLQKKGENGGKNGYFTAAVNLVGLNDMIDKSHKAYYAGSVVNSEEFKESDQLTNFGSYTSFISSQPILVSINENDFVTQMAAGYGFSIVCTNSGLTYGWGFNDKGQLGLGHRYTQSIPQLITTLKHERIVGVSCGQQHVLAITETGACWSWGLGVFGQLGHGDTTDELIPKRIRTLGSVKIIKISTGSFHSIALDSEGKVWSWGGAEYGQQGAFALGNFDDWATGNRASKSASSESAMPRSLDPKVFDHQKIIDISAGYLHNSAITESGTVFTWGWGISGQLGHGNRRFQLTPRIIDNLRGDPIVKLCCGAKHSLAINSAANTTFAFDFEMLINNKIFSDIQFIVEGKIINAHKCLIFNRCSKLAAIITMHDSVIPYAKNNLYQKYYNESLETGIAINEQELNEEIATLNQIRISGIRYPIFMSIIYYLYTDNLKTVYHVALELSDAANKYNLPRLSALAKKFDSQRNATLSLSNEKIQIQIPDSSFSDDIMNLILNKKFSDLTLLVAHDKISVHKAVLWARSEWFKTMLAGGFKENKLNEIRIESIDLEIFKSLIQFMYTGDAEAAHSELVIPLLAIADMFLTKDLKFLCEETLTESLDLENCFYILSESDKYCARRLKRNTELFISSNWQKLKRNDQIELAKSQYPTIVKDIAQIEANKIIKVSHPI